MAPDPDGFCGVCGTPLLYWPRRPRRKPSCTTFKIECKTATASPLRPFAVHCRRFWTASGRAGLEPKWLEPQWI
eukprot:12882540-Prorocentrum_lima.AAC.1